jgi:plastocyanin
MGQTHPVEIRQMKFRPSPVNVTSGDTVVWTNREAMPHTVTADNGEFASETLQNGDTFSHTFNGPQRTVAYHCTIHPGMTGQVGVA